MVYKLFNLKNTSYFMRSSHVFLNVKSLVTCNSSGLLNAVV